MTLQMLDPRAAPPAGAPAVVNAQLLSLIGVPIAVIDNSKPRFDLFVKALLEELCDSYGSVPGVSLRKTNATNYAPDEWYDLVSEQGGAVIVGWGDCGSCSTYSFLDGAAFVRRGVPTVVVISEAFTTLISMLAESQGLENVPRLVLPHPPTDLDDQQLITLAKERAPEVAAILMGGDSGDPSTSSNESGIG
jgi:hypothetical protein